MQKKIILTLLFLLVFVSAAAAQDTKENADLKLAINLFNDKIFDLSIEQFRQFISNYPSGAQAIEARIYIAKALRAMGRRDEARSAFQTFALNYSDNPRAVEAWWAVGELFAEENRFTDAAKAFERIKVFQPKNPLAPKALFTAARYALKGTESENAKKNLLSIISDYPSSDFLPEAFAELGTIYLNEKNYIASRKALRSAFESGSNREFKARTLLRLAELSRKEGNLQEAESSLRALLQMKSIDSLRAIRAEAQIALGILLGTTRRHEEAVQLLSRASADSSYLPEGIAAKAYRSLGDIAYTTMQYKRAAEWYLKYRKKETDSSARSAILFLLGKSYELSGDVHTAVRSYEEAAAAGPADDERELFLRIAVLSRKIKEYGAAVRYFLLFSRQYAADPDAPEALFHAAELARNAMNDPARAAELFDAFLAQYPKHEFSDDAKFCSAQLLETSGKPELALQEYQELIQRYPASQFVPAAENKISALSGQTPANDKQTIRQLSLLIGDLILDTPKKDLAMRLGDIYLDILRDYTQAERQFQKASELMTDISMREEAAYKRTLSSVRLAAQDSAKIPDAKKALEDFLRIYPSGKFSDEIQFELFSLKVAKSTPAQRAEHAESFISRFPTSPNAPAAALIAADGRSSLFKLSAAIEKYRSIAQLYPAAPEAEDARAKLALHLAAAGRIDTAEVVMTEFLLSYPNSRYGAVILAEEGKLFLQVGNTKGAIDAFELLASRFPYCEEYKSSIELLARSYTEAKRFAAAISLYERQLQYYSSPLRQSHDLRNTAILHLAETYHAAHDTVRASGYYKRYISNVPSGETSALVYERLARYAAAQNDPAGSIAYCEESVKAFRTAAVTRTLAESYFEMKDFPKAVKEFTALLSLPAADPALRPEIERLIIRALYRSDKRNDAEKNISSYEKKFGKSKISSADFDFERAVFFFREEEFDKSFAILSSFPMVYDSTSILPDAMFWKGKIFEARNQADSAEMQYQALVRMYPDAAVIPKTQFALGNLYFFREQYDESIKLYRLTLSDQRVPPDIVPYAMNNLIEAYKSVGLYDGAMELIRSFIFRYPEHESIQNKKIDLGILYQKLGYYDQSIVQLESLLETTDKDLESEIRYYLGESYFDKGEYQQAILEFLKVPYLITKKTKIDWTPNSYYMAAQAYEKLNKYDQAVSWYQQIIDKPGIDPAFKVQAQKDLNRARNSFIR